ncbi:hypothetical protein HK405_001050, partial [Cladochytrium tenue]
MLSRPLASSRPPAVAAAAAASSRRVLAHACRRQRWPRRMLLALVAAAAAVAVVMLAIHEATAAPIRFQAISVRVQGVRPGEPRLPGVAGGGGEFLSAGLGPRDDDGDVEPLLQQRQRQRLQRRGSRSKAKAQRVSRAQAKNGGQLVSKAERVAARQQSQSESGTETAGSKKSERRRQGRQTRGSGGEKAAQQRSLDRQWDQAITTEQRRASLDGHSQQLANRQAKLQRALERSSSDPERTAQLQQQLSRVRAHQSYFEGKDQRTTSKGLSERLDAAKAAGGSGPKAERQVQRLERQLARERGRETRAAREAGVTVSGALQAAGVDHAITGGANVARIAGSGARTTNDVDVATAVGGDEAKAALRAASASGKGDGR